AIMLFPYDLVRFKEAKAVYGRYTLKEALEKLLNGSGLVGSFTDKQVIQISANAGTEGASKQQELAQDSQAKGSDEHMNTTSVTEVGRRRRGLLASAVAAVLAGGTASTSAQEPQGQAIEEIAVTGSRIRQSGMQTPTPMTAMVAEEMELLSPGTLMDQLDQLPQFVNNNTLQNASGWT